MKSPKSEMAPMKNEIKNIAQEISEKKDLEKQLLETISLKLCEVEIKLFTHRHQRKGWNTAERITTYFQGSRTKAAFAKLLYTASSVKHGYTITEISDILKITRQSASKIVKESLKENYIYKNLEEFGPNRYYPGKKLIEMVESYVDFVHSAYMEQDLPKDEILLQYLKKVKEVNKDT